MSVADTLQAKPLIVPRDVCRDFDRSSRLEWLDTNHTGAFAMGTVAGVNTRRYHALLISSLKPPAQRYSVLPRVEEVVKIEGREFALGTSQYPGVIHPRGFELLEEFRIDPFPEWRYACGSTSITKTVCLIDRRQSVLVRYRATRACSLTLQLLTSFRDYHSLSQRNGDLRNQPEISVGRISFAPYSQLPALVILHSGFFKAHGDWFLCNEYLRELERGLDFREDLFSPGVIQFELPAEHDAWFLATLESQPYTSGLQDKDVDDISLAEKNRRRFSGASQLEATLARGIDQFRVTRYDSSPSLLAGYPWFTDWSRDILISLPALSKAGFAPSETKHVIAMLISQRSEGLLPNRFLDHEAQPEYNTADATLWLFVAAQEYLDQTTDLEFLRNVLYPAARDILDWHRRGTKYGIHVDPADNLLWVGEPGTQLTWMDAKVRGTAITPRVGKPVEINALWYNALLIVAAWSVLLGFEQEAENLRSQAAATLVAFRTCFWNSDRNCLFDVIAAESRDASVRPNQLLSLSLPHPLLEREKALLIVELVKEKLLTPVGLRTLEPGDPAYRPRFEGSMAERDAAYHQGTVWPWLVGPFVDAYLYAYNNSAEAVRFCRQILHLLEQQLSICCLGSMTEVYDAEAPQHPGGCPAQLWSVAQFLIAAKRIEAFTSA